MENVPDGMTAAEFDQELAELENELRKSKTTYADRALVIVEWARAHLKSMAHCDWCFALRNAPPDTDTGRAGSRLLRFMPEVIVGRKKRSEVPLEMDPTDNGGYQEPVAGLWCHVVFRGTLKHEAYIVRDLGKDAEGAHRFRIRKHMKWGGGGRMKWTSPVTVTREEILDWWVADAPDYDNP